MASIHIALHMMRRLIGTKRGFFMSLLMPALVVSVIAGLANKGMDTHARLAVVNADQGALGKYVVERLMEEEEYVTELISDTEQGLLGRVNDKRANAAVYIPEDYTARILKGEQPQIIMYRMDEQLWNVSLSLTLESEARKLVNSAKALRGEDGAADPDKLQSLLAHQQERRIGTAEEHIKLGTLQTNPVMVGLILMFVLLLVSQSIGAVMEDREERTMARMFTAPLKSIHISAGYFIGSILIGTTQLIIVLVTSYYIFGLTLGLSFGELLLVLECFLFSAVGLSTAVASMVKDSKKLSNLTNVIVIPTCMIGGCFWPISFMPDFMQKLANFTPQKWAIAALDELGAGAAMNEIMLQLGILLLYAAVLIAFGAVALKPNKSA